MKSLEKETRTAKKEVIEEEPNKVLATNVVPYLLSKCLFPLSELLFPLNSTHTIFRELFVYIYALLIDLKICISYDIYTGVRTNRYSIPYKVK